MSSGVITDKKGIEAQMETLGISQEHFTNVEGINSYFDEHKINQLFNVRTNLFVLLSQSMITVTITSFDNRS